MGLFDLFSSKNEKKAADLQSAGYKDAQTEAYGKIDTGQNQLRTDYSSALDQFQPYAQTGLQASGLYSDALGLNGQSGNANAVGAYQSGPGYQFAMDQGLQALDRTAASRGVLAGGGTTADTLRYAQGLANQDYGSWLDRLNGQQALGYNAAGQRAGIYTGQGNAAATAGAQKAGIGYDSITGSADAQAQAELAKDKTGANIFGAITTGLSLGSKLLGIGG